MEKQLFDAAGMAQLYREKPGVWLLLEVLERDQRGRASKLALLKESPNKDELYDYLLEQQQWDWNTEYIFVFSDPDKQCEIL